MFIQNYSHFSMSKNRLFVMVLSIFIISVSLTIFNSSSNVFAITDDDNNNNE